MENKKNDSDMIEVEIEELTGEELKQWYEDAELDGGPGFVPNWAHTNKDTDK